MSGKGDTPRPFGVSPATYASNWDRTFRSTPPEAEFELRFTGKVALVLGLEGSGPMVIRSDDRALVTALVRAVLDASEDSMTVDSYDRNEQQGLEDLLR